MAEARASISTPQEGPRKCKVCAITFLDIYAYTEHIESKEHKKALMKKKYGKNYLKAKANLAGRKAEEMTESDSDNESSDEDGEVYTCELCEKICTGILNYKLHLGGKSHKKKLKKTKLLKMMMMRNKIIQENDDPHEDDTLINGVLIENPFSSSEILCKVCNKKCSGPEAFQQHNDSKSHKKKMLRQNLLNDNGDKKHSPGNAESDDDDDMQCDICCKEFSGPLPYQQHMKSTAHSKQVKQSNQLIKFKDLVATSEDTHHIQCKECNKSFSGPKTFDDHLKSSLHSKLKQKRNLLKTLKEKFPEMATDSTLSIDSEDEIAIILCSVCHTALTGPESARDHFHSQKHKKVVKEKMRFEKYKQSKCNKSNSESISIEDDDEKKNSSDDFTIIE